MPLLRFQLRAEHGLGKPELYAEACRDADPKAVLDGVAVAGLVGILRQLGDLADFAAEVFHGLQEQVMTTASRSSNMMGRVQRIEAALPSLEKRVLAQTSHIHFAYTAGSDWHARIRNEQHHFIDNDLPRFIMDSYEECRDPPRLHVLDKFDSGGPGSCLRRYSDPTFFRRVSTRIDESSSLKVRRDKKTRKIKKKRSHPKNGEFSRGNSLSNHSSRLLFSSPFTNDRASPTGSIEDLTFESGLGDRVNSFDSRSGSGFIECIFSQSDNMQLDERGSNRSSSSRLMQHEDSVGSFSRDEERLSASSIPRIKGFKASSTKLMQRKDSVCSGSHEEESARISSKTRKKSSRASSIQRMQQDSFGSVSCEESSDTIPRSMGKNDMKTLSTHQMQQEDYIGSVSGVESNDTTSSCMRKAGSKASSDPQMKQEDSVAPLAQEESNASVSSRVSRKVSMVSSSQRIEDMESDDPMYHKESDASITTSTRKPDCEETTQLLQHADFVGSDFQGEQSPDVLSTSHPPGTFEECPPSELSVSWEEKMEITMTNEATIGRDEASKLDFAHLQLHGTEQNENLIAKKVNENAIRNNFDTVKKTIPNGDQADDVDSEVDHYVDALNTIESESETDLDCMAKREVNQFSSNAENTKKSFVVEESAVHNLNHHLCNDSSDAASDIISERRIPLNLPEDAASEMAGEEKVSQECGIPHDSNHSLDVTACDPDILDDSKLKTDTHERFSPESPSKDEITSSSSKNPEPPVQLAGVDFWTNGGLLGLQPAKPPVFSPADNLNVDNHKDDDVGEKLHLEESSVCGRSLKRTALVSSLSDPGALIDCSTKSNDSNISGNSNGHGLSSITVVAPGSAVPVAPTAKASPAEATMENEDNSPGVFGLGHRLFMNSFRRKISLISDEKPDLSASILSAVDGKHEASHQTVDERAWEDHLEALSPVKSFPPSPPLEHMKISFQPANDFETSNLGLKFSNHNNGQEKVQDMFTAFQLVPQPSFRMHGAAFDSDDDDDTFCQSSPDNSDDHLSRHSEPNSEQWESDANDASCRFSVESASAPTSYANCVKDETEKTLPDNGLGLLHSFPDCVDGPGLNLPSFDAIKSLPKLGKDVIPQLDGDDVPLHSPGQPTPLPPPLPPADWRFVKSDAGLGKDEKLALESQNDATFTNHLSSQVQRQHKLTPLMPQNVSEELALVATQRKLQNQQKSNPNEESLPRGSDGKTDDKDDFLQQIRAQSFNLRRTTIMKPMSPKQAAPANVKVSAILEKANAIRQVVASDDGEDDSWSDT